MFTAGSRGDSVFARATMKLEIACVQPQRKIKRAYIAALRFREAATKFRLRRLGKSFESVGDCTMKCAAFEGLYICICVRV